MAIGDAAAARGMALVSGAEQANTLDTEDNLTRDYIAEFAAWAKITGKPSTFAPAAHSHAWGDITGKPSTFEPSNHSASKITSGTLNRPVASPSTIWADGEIACDGGFFTNGGAQFVGAWSNNITSTRRAVWMEDDGTLGHTASSARYKKNIKPWAGMTEDEQFAALQVVTFQWKAANADPANPNAVEVGMIAESLHDLGLTFAVFYEPDSFGVLRPEGIHYDRLALLIIPYVQRLGARLADIETRLAALGA